MTTELSESQIALVLADTRAWIEKAVIGLELCPFARPVYVGGRVRFHVSSAPDEDALLEDLARELLLLESSAESAYETTLLIHPLALQDFMAYNAFLAIADRKVDSLGLCGQIQIASFHPRYQFEGTRSDDIGNFTNRSPYPMLHLLRESSVERAVQAIPDPTAIFERNIETLRRLGLDGWRRMFPSA